MTLFVLESHFLLLLQDQHLVGVENAVSDVEVPEELSMVHGVKIAMVAVLIQHRMLIVDVVGHISFIFESLQAERTQMFVLQVHRFDVNLYVASMLRLVIALQAYVEYII